MKDYINKFQYSGIKSISFNRFIYYRLITTLIRGLYYKLFKIKSKGLISVAKNAKIIGPYKSLVCGKICRIEENVLIQTVCSKGITLGDDVTICYGALIRPSGYWGGIIGEGCKIGDHSSIGAYSYVGCAGFIDIGNNVLMGPRITLLAESHNFANTQISIKAQGINRRGIKICDNVWIGADTKILDGVIIGSNSIIGAGSVVNKSVPENSIYAGVPAKHIRSR